MNDVVISLHQVCKEYSLRNALGNGYKILLINLLRGKLLHSTHHTVLKDLCFDIRRGESIGILGKNGAGKSTLLSMLANVIKPTSGELFIQGSVFSMLELGAGFHPDLTGRENILLNGVLLGLLRKTVEEKIQSIIEFAELEDFIDQPIRMYSSGMLARLGFSILIQLDPNILLLDEVFAVGDIHFQSKCHQALQKLKQRADVTLIMVTHDMNAVRMLCDRVLWIENGRIRADGPAEQVVSLFEKALGGRA